jgi:hypothetical protein
VLDGLRHFGFILMDSKYPSKWVVFKVKTPYTESVVAMAIQVGGPNKQRSSHEKRSRCMDWPQKSSHRNQRRGHNWKTGIQHGKLCTFRRGAHGKTPSGTQVFLPEDQRDRHFIEHLNKYYAEVIAKIRGANAILVFGPGDAKFELEKRLRYAELHNHIIGIESADKLTERQIAAKVKNFFASQKQAVQ